MPEGDVFSPSAILSRFAIVLTEIPIFLGLETHFDLKKIAEFLSRFVFLFGRFANAAKAEYCREPDPVSAEVHTQDFPFAERRTRISSEARGRLRLFWTRLEGEAALIVKTVANIPKPMAEAAVKRGVGATPAMRRICQRIPLTPLTRARYRCVWRYLAPTEEPGSRAIEVRAILLGAVNRQPLVVESFGLTVTRHALGRMIDQHPKADLREAMLEAHDHLAVLPTSCGEQVFDLSNVVLPAGNGAFLISPPIRDREGPMLIAKTWIAADLFSEQQRRDFLIWGQFAEASISA